MRPATARELVLWDDLVQANPDGGQILQTRAWGEFKRQHGWTPHYLVDEGRGSRLAILALARGLPGLGSMWYVPKGPGVATLRELHDVVRALQTRRDVFSVKVEPELEDTAATTAALRAMGLVKARIDVQMSRATIVVDLRGDEASLLASFKPKTRYNIRLAARRGVQVEPVPSTDANVDMMYELMAATQERARFLLRPKQYFRGYWQLQTAAGEAQLFFARWNGKVLAGLFATFLGSKAWYKDGGSSPEHRDVMAPHLLQWEVMRWLRHRGVTSYDLVAVPPRRSLHESHPLYGLYRFKAGFSDHIVEFVGTWELINSRLRRQVWEHGVERAAHQWSLRVHHDLLY